jgi:general secretion pathway protein A
MYLNFYQLKNEPFNVTPDPAFLFLSAGHKEAFASIVYAVENRKGFMSITGEVGVGKTTILRSYIKEIDPERLNVIYIINANLSFKGLLKTIFDELEIEFEADEAFEMVNCLQQILIREYKNGRNFVIIIDEAQNMPFETLENLRMLSNLETSTDKLVQILLIGQPEFENMLEQSNLRQLKQRIAVRSTLSPLSKQDCIAYIRHRVAIAGADVDGIFTKSAIKRIIKKANGTPRILNILCDNALITGYGYQQRPITGRTVREVIADFEGKRRFPVLRWHFALSMVFFLLIGVFLFYSQKSNILSIGNNKDLYQDTSMKSIENKEIKPNVEKETTEPIKKKLTTITTLERLSNPTNSSIYLDAGNTVSIKKSDIYDDKTEESLASDNGRTEGFDLGFLSPNSGF